MRLSPSSSLQEIRQQIRKTSGWCLEGPLQVTGTEGGPGNADLADCWEFPVLCVWAQDQSWKAQFKLLFLIVAFKTS